MSVFGLSSYFLWTQKGQTVLPLVRGSGFLLSFQQLHSFYHFHVVTAGHVSCPVRFRKLYGDTVGLRAIGERHISTRLLVPDEANRVAASLDLEFKQHYLPNVDVASLRCTTASEAALQSLSLTPLEVDMDAIEEDTSLIIRGFDAEEERANPNDDGLRLRPLELHATCKAALVSLDYGTVLLGAITDFAPLTADSAIRSTTTTSDERPLLPLSFSGGPVLRKSTGKCVGVLVAPRVMKSAPPRDPAVGGLYQDPYLDISETESLHPKWPIDFAFVPIGEFYGAMRRTEL